MNGFNEIFRERKSHGTIFADLLDSRGSYCLYTAYFTICLNHNMWQNDLLGDGLHPGMLF